MRKRKIVIYVLTLTLCLSAALCGTQVQAKVYKGKFEFTDKKSAISWECDSKTKTMTIMGEGRMGEIDYNSHSWRKLIRKVEIEKLVVGGRVSRISPDLVFGTPANDVIRLELSENVREIGDSAFQFAQNLRYVHLPSKLVKIEKEAFTCTDIRKITIPPGVKKIGEDAFYGCRKLKKVTLSEGVEVLGGFCFGSCNLKQVRLPKSLRVMREGCFRHSGLLSITIPENVEWIGNWAFHDSSTADDEEYQSSLRRVIIKSEKIKHWGKEIFGEGRKDLVIEVPKKKLKEYRKELYSKGLPEYVKVIALKIRK